MGHAVGIRVDPPAPTLISLTESHTCNTPPSPSLRQAASFAGAQADVYVEGLIKGAVVGVFVDGAAVGGGGGGRSKGSTESQGAAISGVDAWNNACTDMLQRARGLGRKSAVGMSVRAKGLRADVGWAGGHSTPRLYIGVDDQ